MRSRHSAPGFAGRSWRRRGGVTRPRARSSRSPRRSRKQAHSRTRFSNAKPARREAPQSVRRGRETRESGNCSAISICPKRVRTLRLLGLLSHSRPLRALFPPPSAGAAVRSDEPLFTPIHGWHAVSWGHSPTSGHLSDGFTVSPRNREEFRMRSLLTTLLLAACAVLSLAPAARADSLLFDYVGFDYEFPNPNAATFGEPGSGYVGLGTVPFLFAPLVSNTALNEYTFVITCATPTALPVGTMQIINYASGTVTIYEDAKAGGTPGTFTANPPNGDVPGTFADGTPILVGTLTNFQLVVDTATGVGS